MFKKIVMGKVSLKETFWKYGVLCLISINIVTKLFGIMLQKKLHGYSIFGYYSSFFSGLSIEVSAVVLTVLYLSSFAFLLFYATSIVMGVWRSSAQYNQSLWLKYLARICIVVLAVITFKTSF